MNGNAKMLSINFRAPKTTLEDFDKNVGAKRRSEMLRDLMRLYNAGKITHVKSQLEQLEVSKKKS